MKTLAIALALTVISTHALAQERWRLHASFMGQQETSSFVHVSQQACEEQRDLIARILQQLAKTDQRYTGAFERYGDLNRNEEKPFMLYCVNER